METARPRAVRLLRPEGRPSPIVCSDLAQGPAMRNLCSTWPLSITSKVLAIVRRSRHTHEFVNLRLASATLLSVDAIKALNPQSPQARAIFNLGIVTAIVMTVIFAVVVGIVVYALLRFPRWREGERDPEQGRGNKTIEIVWTAIPLAIVAVLFVLAARTMGISDPPPPPKPDIVVIGHQWWWEARYTNSGAGPVNRKCTEGPRPFSADELRELPRDQGHDRFGDHRTRPHTFCQPQAARRRYRCKHARKFAPLAARSAAGENWSKDARLQV